MSVGNGSILNPRSVTWAGLVADAALAAAKMLGGIVFFSQTILADGLHSASDLVTDVAVLAGLRMASKPADGRHHYGHGRISTLVALFVGVVLLAAAGYIAIRAIYSLHELLTDSDALPVRGTVPFFLAAASVPVKELLFQITRYVGRRTGNVSLIANAWHHRSDAFTSVAAAAGLAGVAFGGPAWRFLDPLTAMALGTFLVVVAVRIMRKAASELIDRAPGAATLAAIKQLIATTPGVRGYHALRARQIGGKVVMDIHIQVDPELTVYQGHEIAAAVKHKVIEAESNVVEVVVHVEPDQQQPSGQE